MQRIKQRLDGADERGAVAIVFALSLLVLIGFVGLAVDVGSAYAKSQEVQNAADAGALAIAQECADAKSACVVEDERDRARDFATYNIQNGYDPDQRPDVDFPMPNRVTVTVTAENRNYFASLFGYETFTISREATAQWDAPQSGPAMIPLAISACSFYDQAKKTTPDLGSLLRIFVPKGGPDSGICKWHDDYPPGGFGWLYADADSCEVFIQVGNEVKGIDGFAPPECVKRDGIPEIAAGDTVLLPIFKAAVKKKGPPDGKTLRTILSRDLLR